MRHNYIKDEADRLIKRCCSTDPFEICKATGVMVRYADLGGLKGLYKYLLKNRFILINENLDSYSARIVCAHELGHDRLHRYFAKDSFLQDYMIYDMDKQPEYEANLFACELLIEDARIIEHIREGYSTKQIAQLLCIDENLVQMKISALNARGRLKK